MKVENRKTEIPPLVVIVGPTGSGKSALAMDIARKYNGEIICADSRTVYKGMDIGTAKPSGDDQTEIPHHLLDMIEPDQTFTAAEFKRQALAAIDTIHSRGKLPIMVGGTGLYVDGVIFDFAFLPPVPAEERERLEQMSVSELQAMIDSLNLELPENKENRRHLIRRIETNGQIPVKKGLRDRTLVLGVELEKQELIRRLEARVQKMLDQGLEQEVEGLAKKYGWQAPGMTGLGYREWRTYFEGGLTRKEVVRAIINGSWQYARRQRTWFRRNQHIRWVKNSAEVEVLVKYFLQRKQ